MQRDEHSAADETVHVTEEAKPALSLEDLVSGLGEEGSIAKATSEKDETQATPLAAAAKANVVPTLRTARVLGLSGRRATVSFRSGETVDAMVSPEVERELVEEAAAHKDAVLVETEGDGEAVIVGLLQTRRPSEVRVTGSKVVVEAEHEVLLRAGRAAIRLREDGDIEIVGSRISAASRGLFRIVGRILRLN